MALFHLSTKSISRASGRSAPGAAAYRAGERIRDERTGELYNYSRRADVSHAEIIVPSALEATAPDWIRQRAALWNAAEAAERRRNSRVAREYQVALPAELSAAQRLELARAFARELADRYRVAVDLAMHDPRAAGDSRNFHAHLLTTTREITAQGLGGKAQAEWNGTKRFEQGLGTSRLELTAVRERWAVLTNQAFRTAGLDLRIDHRTLAAQGIDREPVPHFPYAALQMERRGMRSELAEHIRAAYQARLTARHEESAVARREQTGVPAAPRAEPGLEELQRRARDAWLQIRRHAQSGLDTARSGTPALAANLQGGIEGGAPAEAARNRTRDQDFSL